MKRLAFVALAIGLVVSLGLATRSSAAASKHSKIVIRHQMHGCHAWSFAGGAFRAKISGKIARGSTITFVNNDVMPHKLIKKSGPAVSYTGHRAMNKIGAWVRVKFTHPGVYRLTTKAGEDYPGMEMKTIGTDNVLRLTVTVF